MPTLDPKADALQIDNDTKEDVGAMLAKTAAAALPTVAISAALTGSPELAGLLGSVAGSLFAELVGSIIPNQKVDRIVKFLQALELRIAHLEEAAIRRQLEDEEFTELFEEAIRQAARSTSDERRAYIASIIAHSLTPEEIEHQESKHLLRILGEVNDVEVLWLRLHLESTMAGVETFREKHKDALRPAVSTFGSGQRVSDKSTLQSSFLEHLAQLGLLTPQYRFDREKERPEFDKWTGAPVVDKYQLTSLGRLLLRHVGLAD